MANAPTCWAIGAGAEEDFAAVWPGMCPAAWGCGIAPSPEVRGATVTTGSGTQLASAPSVAGSPAGAGGVAEGDGAALGLNARPPEPSGAATDKRAALARPPRLWPSREAAFGAAGTLATTDFFFFFFSEPAPLFTTTKIA